MLWRTTGGEGGGVVPTIYSLKLRNPALRKNYSLDDPPPYLICTASVGRSETPSFGFTIHLLNI